MKLENLFEMVKADRYTQDGRETIIKAQKGINDRTYQIGEISERTGLLKTATGWVSLPTKNGVSKHEDVLKDPKMRVTKHPSGVMTVPYKFDGTNFIAVIKGKVLKSPKKSELIRAIQKEKIGSFGTKEVF